MLIPAALVLATMALLPRAAAAPIHTAAEPASPAKRGGCDQGQNRCNGKIFEVCQNNKYVTMWDCNNPNDEWIGCSLAPIMGCVNGRIYGWTEHWDDNGRWIGPADATAPNPTYYPEPTLDADVAMGFLDNGGLGVVEFPAATITPAPDAGSGSNNGYTYNADHAGAAFNAADLAALLHQLFGDHESQNPVERRAVDASIAWAGEAVLEAVRDLRALIATGLHKTLPLDEFIDLINEQEIGHQLREGDKRVFVRGEDAPTVSSPTRTLTRDDLVIAGLYKFARRINWDKCPTTIADPAWYTLECQGSLDALVSAWDINAWVSMNHGGVFSTQAYQYYSSVSAAQLASSKSAADHAHAYSFLSLAASRWENKPTPTPTPTVEAGAVQTSGIIIMNTLAGLMPPAPVETGATGDGALTPATVTADAHGPEATDDSSTGFFWDSAWASKRDTMSDAEIALRTHTEPIFQALQARTDPNGDAFAHWSTREMVTKFGAYLEALKAYNIAHNITTIGKADFTAGPQVPRAPHLAARGLPAWWPIGSKSSSSSPSPTPSSSRTSSTKVSATPSPTVSSVITTSVATTSSTATSTITSPPTTTSAPFSWVPPTTPSTWFGYPYPIQEWTPVCDLDALITQHYLFEDMVKNYVPPPYGTGLWSGSFMGAAVLVSIDMRIAQLQAMYAAGETCTYGGSTWRPPSPIPTVSSLYHW